MFLTALWSMTPAQAQDGLGLPIDYQVPTPQPNLTDEMYPNTIDSWNGIPSGTIDSIWEPSTSNQPLPERMRGEFNEFLQEARADQAMATSLQLQKLAGDNVALTIISASLFIGGIFCLASRIVHDMTLEIIMKTQVPGEGFSLAVAKYLHAIDPRAFEKAEKAAYLKQQDARDQARAVTNVTESQLTSSLTEFLAQAEVKITNTYFKAPLKALSLIETGLTLAELAKSGALTPEQKSLLKPVMVSLIASLYKAAAERREATYQPISLMPLFLENMLPPVKNIFSSVKKPKMDELEAADALEEFAAEIKTFHTAL